MSDEPLYAPNRTTAPRRATGRPSKPPENPVRTLPLQAPTSENNSLKLVRFPFSAVPFLQQLLVEGVHGSSLPKPGSCRTRRTQIPLVRQAAVTLDAGDYSCVTPTWRPWPARQGFGTEGDLAIR
jgi:hypothetical protein